MDRASLKSPSEIQEFNKNFVDDISVFTDIYENKIWGDNGNPEYKGTSGTGSTLEFTTLHYIPFVRNFIRSNEIATIVDLGCGDFKCGEALYQDLDIEYIGVDAYEKVIQHHQKKYGSMDPPRFQFHHLNFRIHISDLPEADLCIIKDVLQHWNILQIYMFLDELVQCGKFKYIMICNCCCQEKDNQDIAPGEWRGLTVDMYPLKKYNPTKVSCVERKEISIISSFDFLL